MISAIILNFTRAKYRATQSIPLVNGTINYSLADLNVIAVYIGNGNDYSKSDTVPSNGYIFNEEKSYCTVNDEENTNITLSYDVDTQTLNIAPFTTKGTKCYLYFDEQKTFKDIILADNGGTSTIEGKDTPDFSQPATTDEGIYATTDNLGTTYYFRGAVTNNYISFAEYYWRIIRINGDGSIRIIYDGTSAHANGESSDDRQIGTSAYNSTDNASYYVGYTYQADAQRPSSQNGGTPSTIKEVLDSWYSTNITNQGYDSKVVSTAGFCNDRNMASGYSWSATPSSTIRYAVDERLYTNKTPTLKCSNNNDIYTTKVGLITADEVAYAGGVWGQNNNSYYLYTGQFYWTISPSYFASTGYANVYFVRSDGNLRSYSLDNVIGVRPVINLSADITISSGDGTQSNPYVIS